MKPSPKQQKLNESQQSSLNFDDNYNEEECLQQNNKIQKLSIMDDFGQLCQKLNHPFEEEKLQGPEENTLASYYARLRQKNNQSSQEPKTHHVNIVTTGINEKITNTYDYPSQKIHKSLQQSHQVRSSSSNIPQYQQGNPPNNIKHERNPSQGQAFKKKIVQELEMNDSKRNYSSVQDKKKILQPSKNPVNTQQNLSIKDYYGEQKNIILKKQTIKHMISKECKPSKQSTHTYTNQVRDSQGLKSNKQNNLKESNLINHSKKSQPIDSNKNSKVIAGKDLQKANRPQIVLFNKKINLNQDTEKLRALLIEEQTKSDYDISNDSVSSIDQGLFGNAIERQRNSKTIQNVSSSHVHINLCPPNRKEQILNGQKQYISSPISIGHSPNPTNMPKSLFQKRQVYRC